MKSKTTSEFKTPSGKEKDESLHLLQEKHFIRHLESMVNLTEHDHWFKYLTLL